MLRNKSEWQILKYHKCLMIAITPLFQFEQTEQKINDAERSKSNKTKRTKIKTLMSTFF